MCFAVSGSRNSTIELARMTAFAATNLAEGPSSASVEVSFAGRFAAFRFRGFAKRASIRAPSAIPTTFQRRAAAARKRRAVGSAAGGSYGAAGAYGGGFRDPGARLRDGSRGERGFQFFREHLCLERSVLKRGPRFKPRRVTRGRQRRSFAGRGGRYVGGERKVEVKSREGLQGRRHVEVLSSEGLQGTRNAGRRGRVRTRRGRRSRRGLTDRRRTDAGVVTRSTRCVTR